MAEDRVQSPQEPIQDRLQKIIAAAGVCSRRKAEELILAGRVQVNGKIVTELGTKADASRDHIRVDGKLLQGPERQRYYIKNNWRFLSRHGRWLAEQGHIENPTQGQLSFIAARAKLTLAGFTGARMKRARSALKRLLPS